MPMKRRAGKAKAFDDYRMQQLVEGPDACLLAGVGYLAAARAARWADLTPDEQAAATAAMRADWERHGAGIMEWWGTGEGSACEKPWCFVLPPRDPSTKLLPWAAQQFGEPA